MFHSSCMVAQTVDPNTLENWRKKDQEFRVILGYMSLISKKERKISISLNICSTAFPLCTSTTQEVCGLQPAAFIDVNQQVRCDLHSDQSPHLHTFFYSKLYILYLLSNSYWDSRVDFFSVSVPLPGEETKSSS